MRLRCGDHNAQCPMTLCQYFRIFDSWGSFRSEMSYEHTFGSQRLPICTILNSRWFVSCIDHQSHSRFLNETKHDHRRTSGVMWHHSIQPTRDGGLEWAVPWPMAWSLWPAKLVTTVTWTDSLTFAVSCCQALTRVWLSIWRMFHWVWPYANL
jgi:hypothetical protein